MRFLFCFILMASPAWALRFDSKVTKFDALWKKSARLSEMERKRALVEISPYYLWKLRRFSNPDTALKQQLAEYPRLRERILFLNETLPKWLHESLVPFKAKFPDFEDTGITVHLLHSLEELDGGTREISGKTFFLFGLESMAKYHSTFTLEAKRPFLQHELLHVYHRQFYQPSDTLVSGLWTEGLAVYVAELLNPKATRAQLSLDNPKGLLRRCVEKRMIILADIQRRLRKPEAGDYGFYFLNERPDSEIPRRAGYAFGYEIVRNLAQKIPVETLIKISAPEALVRSEIDRLSKR